MHVRSGSASGARRPAFTLAELVVSIGILVVLLGLASQVMSLTVRSTGQARALTEVSQTLRVLERTLREDLAGVQRPGPGVDEASVLLIQGNPINAYWTRNQQAAAAAPNPLNDPDLLTLPRADLLMIFTRREAESYVQYVYPDAADQRQRTPPMRGWKQVVYGHAHVRNYIPNPASGPNAPPYVFDSPPASLADAFPDFDAVSGVPAEDWHLARRLVHLTSDMQVAVPTWSEADQVDKRLPSAEILSGTTDILGGEFDYGRDVATPAPEPPALAPDGWPWYLPPIFFGPDGNPVRPFDRSMLDPTPPPRFADRLGHYFLPNCASFKVEWALDPYSPFVGGRLEGEKRIFWIDPGDQGDLPDDPSDDDPLRDVQRAVDEANEVPDQVRAQRLQDLLDMPLGGTTALPYSLRERFGTGSPQGWLAQPYGDGQRPNLAVFTATRIADPATGDLVAEEVFPAALRITVDLYDRERRLGKPVRHVMILPVGDR